MDFGLLPIYIPSSIANIELSRAAAKLYFLYLGTLMKTHSGARNPSLSLLAHRVHKKGRSVVHGVLTPLEHSLTLTHKQYPAMVGNTGTRKPVADAEFVKPCNAQQPQSVH